MFDPWFFGGDDNSKESIVENFLQRAATGLGLAPASRNAGTVTTSWVDTANCGEVSFVLLVGAMTATATLDGKLEQSETNDGNGVTDVTGSAIAQLTAAGAAGSAGPNTCVTVGAITKGQRLKGRYLRMSVTTAAAAVIYGIAAICTKNDREPVTNTPASVLT